MTDYKIIYNDDKVVIIRSIDTAHAKEKAVRICKAKKINSCKKIKNENSL